ncbi:MAG TPA: type II toxin-antitoxin system RelE/ParE family toxin [Pirellulales bacterium]
MPAVRRKSRADPDLARIVDFIAQDNLSAALAWLDNVEALFRLLASQPEMGQRRKSRRFNDAQRHSHGMYVIYYRPITGGIEVLCVLHAARDQGRQP